MHTAAKQMKSADITLIWGKTLEKSLFRVLTTPEKDSEKAANVQKISKKR